MLIRTRSKRLLVVALLGMVVVWVAVVLTRESSFAPVARPVDPQPRLDQRRTEKPAVGDPIDPVTVEAWRRVGCEVDGGKAGWGEIPEVRANPKVDVSRLPEIRVPFVLHLTGEEKAAWLRQFPGVKNAIHVSIWQGGVTDDILAVLAEFGLLHTIEAARTAEGVGKRSPEPEEMAGWIFDDNLFYPVGPKRPTSPDELVVLDLRGTRVTGASFKELSRFKNLTLLDLRGTPTSDVGLEALASLPNLAALQLTDTKVTDAGLKHLTGLGKLTVLGLGGGEITAAGMEHVGQLRQLKCLHLLGKWLTDDTLRQVAELKRLTVLSLGGAQFFQITDAGLEHLAGLEALTRLHLGRVHVSGTGLVHLRGLRNLTELTLSSTRELGERLSHLAALPNLTTLDLRQNPASDDVRKIGGPGIRYLKHLSGCKHLTDLQLSGYATTKLTDEAMEAYAEAGLLHLVPGATAIDGKRPTRIEDVVSLGLLWYISDKSVKHLKKFTNLTSLTIRSRVSDEGIAELRKALPKCEIRDE